MSGQDDRRRPFWFLRRGRAQVEADIDEELSFHLDMRTEELRAGGMSAEQARREAIRQFGDLEGTRRSCRRDDERKQDRVQRGLLLADLGQDLAACVSGLRRAPLLALTIVVTVGLGIGTTTAMFGAINASLLRPLPYRDPGQLVSISNVSGAGRWSFSVADYLALEQQQTQFAEVAGFGNRALTFTDDTTAELLQGRIVSWRYFHLLGLRPALGRDFTESDGRPGSSPAVIVSDRFWRRRLGARPDAIGRPLRLDGADHLLAGVLAEAGPLEQDRDFFVAARWETPPRRGPFFITALGRLGPGVDRAAATAQLQTINRRIFPLWKASYQDEKASWGMDDLKQHVLGDVRAIAALAIAAVALVWLIACANASGLLIARVISRRRELAVRTALGASRGRVMRYLLAESLLLAAGAAGLGVALAALGITALQHFGAAYLPRTREITFDGPVLAFLGAVTAASLLLFGLVPAVHGTGGSLPDSLRASGLTATGNRGARRLRRMLVGAQFLVATPLLVIAALLLASLHQLKQVDLGFDGHNLASAAILLPQARYRTREQVTAFWDGLQRRVESVPGVAGVAFADGRPPRETAMKNNFDLEAQPVQPGHPQPVCPWVSVTPEYFKLLGVSLLRGRLLDRQDGPEAPRVVVVDRTWERRFFGNANAVGKRFRAGGCTTCPWTTVVGVVSDVKYAGLDRPERGIVYWPMARRGEHNLERMTLRFRFLIVRTSLAPAAVDVTIRKLLQALDPGVPYRGLETADAVVDRSLELPRLLSVLMAGFAAVALLLSMVGIYGLMAHFVEQHRKELAVRLALGGLPASLLRFILGQGMKVVAAGIVLGVAAALALTRQMSALLFGVTATDAVSFVTVSALLFAMALVACCLPARRAIALQPAQVLRSE